MSETSSQDRICCKLFDLSEIIADYYIDDEKREALCFRENLLIVLKEEIEKNTKPPVGGYSISVENIGSEGLEFLVHVVSSMNVDGFFGGSKVIGSVTEKFHCLEEKRNEFIEREEGRQEKILFMGAEDDVYHVETTQICGFEKETQNNNLKFCCTQNLLSEAGNILLMRYLALTNFHGALQFESVTIDGRIAICNYRCSAAQRMKYNDSQLEIYTIERRIHAEFGPVQNIISYMTRKGRILKHDWTEVPYMLQINPLIDLNEMQCGKMPEKIPLKGLWQKDMELLSEFVDQKTCKMAQKAQFLADHPELKNMIADYVQALLFVKPIDVLTFTIQHFLAFASEIEPMEYPSKCEEIESQVLKLFGNLEMKSERRESVKSQEPGKLTSPKCPACSICSSNSSQICTQHHANLSGKVDFSRKYKCSLCSRYSDFSCEGCQSLSTSESHEKGKCSLCSFHSELNCKGCENSSQSEKSKSTSGSEF